MFNVYVQVLYDLPLPKISIHPKNGTRMFSRKCCPEMNHKSDTFLLDTFDNHFQTEFGCVLPIHTNIKNQSLMCDLGGLPETRRIKIYNTFVGKFLCQVNLKLEITRNRFISNCQTNCRKNKIKEIFDP